MIKTTLSIEGMHCRSCELLIEEEISQIDGVKKVSASFRREEVTIESKKAIDSHQIERAVGKAGYKIATEKKAKPWFSRNKEDYKDLLLVLIVLIVFYAILRQFHLGSLLPQNGAPSSLIFVFIIGLTAGVSTCMALVGGLVLGVSARFAEKHPQAEAGAKFRPHLFFNLGRLISFFVLGGLIGLIGEAIQFSSLTLGLMTIAVGMVMFILGLQLVEIFPKVSKISLSLPRFLTRRFRLNQNGYSHVGTLLLGGATFFLPCGFTQAMQLYAVSTGSFWRGALVMGLFALGTTPGLLGLGGLTALVKGVFKSYFFKFVGVVVIILAIFNVSNGLNLANIITLRARTAQSHRDIQDPNVKEENGVQIVKMTQTARGYEPNDFTIKNNLPVKWEIDSEAPNSCAASIVASEIGVRRFLTAGENTIDFTPSKEGTIKFTCSMGMYSGKFRVVASSQAPTGNSAATPSPSQGQTDFSTQTEPGVQLITATYVSGREDIRPKEFQVEAGKKVRFEIKSLVEVGGCMGSVALPGLVQTPQFMEKGKVIAFEFTPQKKGDYQITCGMGTPRGVIKVI